MKKTLKWMGRWSREVIVVYLWLGCLHLAGCGPMTFVVGVSPGDQRLVSTMVASDGGWFNDRVAIVDVSGLIHNGRKPGLLARGDNPVSLLHEQLAQAGGDERVKAVILRLNTPGGTVTASDTMYRMVKRFEAESGKPVLALMMDVAASGGYYLACAANTIVAYPTTITGSIGVIMQTISFKPAMSRVGIQAEAITSGPNKDAGSPFSTLTEEGRAVLQAMVDDFYERFVTVVRQARGEIPEDRFAAVTDGRVITGSQAVQLGLVDQVGDLHTAFELAKRMGGMKRADLIRYHRPLEYVGSPYASAPGLETPYGVESGGTQINLAQINFSANPAESSTMFYYLWQMQ